MSNPSARPSVCRGRSLISFLRAVAVEPCHIEAYFWLGLSGRFLGRDVLSVPGSRSALNRTIAYEIARRVAIRTPDLESALSMKGAAFRGLGLNKVRHLQDGVTLVACLDAAQTNIPKQSHSGYPICHGPCAGSSLYPVHGPYETWLCARSPRPQFACMPAGERACVRADQTTFSSLTSDKRRA